MGAKGAEEGVVRFVALGPDHADALAALFERNAVTSVPATFDPFALDVEQAHQIALKPGRDLYFAALAGEELVGFSMLRGFEEGYAVPSFGIFVDEAHQGRGLGRRLTEWTVDRARERGCPAVRLSVYTSNPTAHALYESLGFAERERSKLLRDGRTDEKIVMSLELAS